MLQKELAKRLKARYDTKTDGNEWMEVSSDGIPLCRIKYNGQYLSNADQNLSDEYRSKIADIQDEISTVREYVGLYEHAPQMKADGVSDYRQLAAFEDTVLAATYSEKNGFMFCTWKQNADGGSVFLGDYSPNYEYVKEAFAVRSGLVSKDRLFSENESAYLCRCVDFAKVNCETLTYEQERQLDKLQKNSQMHILPSKPSRQPLNRNQHHNRICNTINRPSVTQKPEGFFYFTRRTEMTVFSNSPYDRRMEQLMMTVPNFAPRGMGFRFTGAQLFITITTATPTEILTETMRQVRCPPFRKRFDEYIPKHSTKYGDVLSSSYRRAWQSTRRTAHPQHSCQQKLDGGACLSPSARIHGSCHSKPFGGQA